jgi:hypothetical protein
VNTEVLQAHGTAERDAALVMLEQIPGEYQVTVGADKGYDTKDFVAECRNVSGAARSGAIFGGLGRSHGTRRAVSAT